MEFGFNHLTKNRDDGRVALKNNLIGTLGEGGLYDQEQKDLSESTSTKAGANLSRHQSGIRKGSGGGNVLGDRSADVWLGSFDKYGNPI